MRQLSIIVTAPDTVADALVDKAEESQQLIGVAIGTDILGVFLNRVEEALE